ATAARINELLDRSADTPVSTPSIPLKLKQAAIDSGAATRFVSRELGSGLERSPLPTLTELQNLAVQLNPDLRAREAMVRISEAELELAGKEHLPDVDVSLQYGQRSGYMMTPNATRTPRSDMISVVVSIPIPVQRRNKQSAVVAATRATLSNTQLELRASENRVRTEVARIYSDVSHQRTVLALLVNAVIPQARATVDATMGDYQSGRGDLTSVLAARASLFELDVSYQRALADFAQKVAELEAMVGKELIP
ncbi:MAG TPA: TolC family protein, partial [Gemmatimonadaceae bacterium]|nr:TolC family protein [Gemmatimonadaceae bacterium]